MWLYCLWTCYILCIKYSGCLKCHSEQVDKASPILCTAVQYEQKNCSESFLTKNHPGLFGIKYWPDKPRDVHIVPIQKQWRNSICPGFEFHFFPPRSVSIQYVRGFQLNYEVENSQLMTCVILEIKNTTLNFEHRNKNLSLTLQIWPMTEATNFIFTTWSLPKPPISETDTNQIRYGRTGVNITVSEESSGADWVTTISYYYNPDEKSIQIWFVPAPDDFHFLGYDISLVKILGHEGEAYEDRNTINRTTLILETEFTFQNVPPGRYRVGVLPIDDKSGTFFQPKCKCIRSGVCHSCMKTVTSVINVPKDQPQFTHRPTEATSVAGDKSTQNQDRSYSIPEYVIPSVLGFVAFLLLVFTVVGCYKFKSEKGKNAQQQRSSYSNQVHTIPDKHFLKQYKKITVAIIYAEESQDHRCVVHSFAAFLQTTCHLNVLFRPWTSKEFKLQRVANADETADFNIIVASESTMDLCKTGINSTLDSTKDSSEWFISFLNAGSVHDPNIARTLILVLFEHTEHVTIPKCLNMRHFVLNRELKEFLHYLYSVNKIKVDIRQISTIEDMEMTKECINLSRAIQQAVQAGKTAVDDTESIKSVVTVNPEDFLNHTKEIKLRQKTCSSRQVEPLDLDSILQSHGRVHIDCTKDDLQDEIDLFNYTNCDEVDGYSV